jgi:integrase
MSQADAYRMIRRRAADAGIRTKIGCHTFRATGITEYLRNGGKLEVAQQIRTRNLGMTTKCLHPKVTSRPILSMNKPERW